jgi:DNA-binding ferritin-like protein
LLNARLADGIDLQTQTKQAHWNVKGPNFIALHELFDKINEEVEDYVDDIAERLVGSPPAALDKRRPPPISTALLSDASPMLPSWPPMP